MTSTLHRASRNRLLVIVAPEAIRDVLAKQAKQRSLVALVTSRKADPVESEPVIEVLLDYGCEYFVCVGADSEALHDLIDGLLVARAAAVTDLNVTTTWHEDETPADVAEFFFNVAAGKESALLVAVIGEDETELARALAEQASV